MERYRNLRGNSGVVAYQVVRGGLVVAFADGGVYLYNNDIPGAPHIERMTQLAVAGKGLSAYIATHVRQAYARKLR